MDFALSPRAAELRERLQAFVADVIEPGAPVYAQQVHDSGDAHFHPPVMEDMKADARARGLWNLFLPDEEEGAGLTNLEYAPLCEIMGRHPLTAEATNCAAPDTGNMEVLHLFGTPLQQEQFLRPLLDGTTRSCFAMTEPWVASSDATNISSRIERDGDHYVVNAHKWWTSGAASARCTFTILMGVTDPDADAHRRHSMILIPMDTPGVSVERALTVFGASHGGGHCETLFQDVRVPATNLLGEEGSGFAIAQARLGPGRIHHCMRAIGMAERALELMSRTGADARRVREAPRRQRGRPAADRREPHRDRAGTTADDEGGVADGHRRREGRPVRDLRDQGGGGPPRDHRDRPGDPGVRWRRGQRRLAARRDVRARRARCTSSTVPTRSTSCRSPAASCAPTRASGHERVT